MRSMIEREVDPDTPGGYGGAVAELSGSEKEGEAAQVNAVLDRMASHVAAKESAKAEHLPSIPSPVAGKF